jgi:hypothetical protein
MACAGGVRHCQYQANWARILLGNDLPLLLGQSELTLEVDETAFHLDMHQLEGMEEQQVCRPQISRRDDMFELWHPIGVGTPDDLVRNLELARVAEAHGARRVEAPAELGAASRRELAPNRQPDGDASILGLAHLLLADIGQTRQLGLREAGGRSRDSQLAPEPSGKLSGPCHSDVCRT